MATNRFALYIPKSTFMSNPGKELVEIVEDVFPDNTAVETQGSSFCITGPDNFFKSQSQFETVSMELLSNLGHLTDYKNRGDVAASLFFNDSKKKVILASGKVV